MNRFKKGPGLTLCLRAERSLRLWLQNREKDQILSSWSIRSAWRKSTRNGSEWSKRNGCSWKLSRWRGRWGPNWTGKSRKIWCWGTRLNSLRIFRRKERKKWGLPTGSISHTGRNNLYCTSPMLPRLTCCVGTKRRAKRDSSANLFPNQRNPRSNWNSGISCKTRRSKREKRCWWQGIECFDLHLKEP